MHIFFYVIPEIKNETESGLVQLIVFSKLDTLNNKNFLSIIQDTTLTNITNFVFITYFREFWLFEIRQYLKTKANAFHATNSKFLLPDGDGNIASYCETTDWKNKQNDCYISLLE